MNKKTWLQKLLEEFQNVKWRISNMRAFQQNTHVDIIGTSNNDTLKGSDNPDLQEWVFGLDGDDTLIATKGNDTLIGGAGNDTYVFKDGHFDRSNIFDDNKGFNKVELNDIKNPNEISIEYFPAHGFYITFGADKPKQFIFIHNTARIDEIYVNGKLAYKLSKNGMHYVKLNPTLQPDFNQFKTKNNLLQATNRPRDSLISLPNHRQVALAGTRN